MHYHHKMGPVGVTDASPFFVSLLLFLPAVWRLFYFLHFPIKFSSLTLSSTFSLVTICITNPLTVLLINWAGANSLFSRLALKYVNFKKSTLFVAILRHKLARVMHNERWSICEETRISRSQRLPAKSSHNTQDVFCSRVAKKMSLQDSSTLWLAEYPMFIIKTKYGHLWDSDTE